MEPGEQVTGGMLGKLRAGYRGGGESVLAQICTEKMVGMLMRKKAEEGFLVFVYLRGIAGMRLAGSRDLVVFWGGGGDGRG